MSKLFEIFHCSKRYFSKTSAMTTLEEKVSSMRIDYNVTKINDDNLPSKDPYAWFKLWFEKAVEHPGIVEANAMNIATCSKDGIPSARTVLLKQICESGFQFYTNSTSEKGKEIAENPYAALTFYWEPLQVQVRIKGVVERISEEESKKYFHSRPFASQIGAVASIQSSVIPNYQCLEEKRVQLTNLHDGKEVPKPERWGGYLVKPWLFEFWAGGSGRLHRRVRFRKPADGEVIDENMTRKGEKDWLYEFLSP